MEMAVLFAGIFLILVSNIAESQALTCPYHYRRTLSKYLYYTIKENTGNNAFCGASCDEDRTKCVGFYTEENKCYLLENDVNQGLTPRQMFLADCEIELLSIGADDSGPADKMYKGIIKINGLIEDYLAFPNYGGSSNYRGVSIVVIEQRCVATQQARYDTYKSAGGGALDSFLSTLSAGTMVAAICMDECSNGLGPAHTALQDDFGVTISGYRATHAFIAWKGSPEKAKLVRANRYAGPSQLQSFFQRW